MIMVNKSFLSSVEWGVGEILIPMSYINMKKFAEKYFSQKEKNLTPLPLGNFKAKNLNQHPQL